MRAAHTHRIQNVGADPCASLLRCGRLLALCEVHRHTPYVYLGVSPVWLIFLCEWLWAICWRHVDVAVDLHRLLLWVPIIELLHCVLSIFHFWLCPWRSTIEQIVGAGWIILTILKEPVMLVCLLLVAKVRRPARPPPRLQSLARSRCDGALDRVGASLGLGSAWASSPSPR